MRILAKKVATVCCLGLISAMIGVATPVPSSAETPSTGTSSAAQPIRCPVVTTASSPGPLSLGVPWEDDVDLSISPDAASPALAVACVRIWLTPTSPYLCCAGRGWMHCQPLS